VAVVLVDVDSLVQVLVDQVVAVTETRVVVLLHLELDKMMVVLDQLVLMNHLAVVVVPVPLVEMDLLM
jgi:hypothetical protein